MTNPRPKFQIFKLFKLILISLAAVTVALFTAASLRTLSLDVNVGLQLAAWEKARNISLVVDAQRRDELLANFKEAVRIPTVSFSETDLNTTALLQFDRLLRKAFPTPVGFGEMRLFATVSSSQC
eukprot:XP_011619699.1 PREDICTED: probable carboxypeptidase PM20D1.2 [Takifugu rubripes]